MMKSSICTIFIIFLLSLSTYSEIRYVSKKGSSTPPYTSWSTAGSLITPVMAASNYGDTIYVASGVYVDTVKFKPGITLIGSGMDSCIIDISSIKKIAKCAILMNDCTIEGFTFRGKRGGFNIIQSGVCSYDEYSQNIKIRFNRFRDFFAGISCSGDSDVLFQHNMFYDCDNGISLKALSRHRIQVIENCSFSNVDRGVDVFCGTKPLIHNNTFYLAPYIGPGVYSPAMSAVNTTTTDTSWAYNNLVISKDAFSGLDCRGDRAVMNNNLLIGKFRDQGIYCSRNATVKNNVVLNAARGIEVIKGNPVIKYNNCWKSTKANYYGFTADSTNMSLDPMFLSDSVYQLQMFSPMIDSGDPLILDIDGTRSDIGLFGGPYGERYTYQDLAPRCPVNIQAKADSGWITLKWNKNTESDFSYYTVYKDTLQNFIADSSKIVYKGSDTLYKERLPIGYPKKQVYRITATDNTGNQSTSSEEAVMVTKVREPFTPLKDCMLYQNYPNPFNPVTIISYRIREKSDVSLKLYDIQGKMIGELIHSEHSEGYYEKELNAAGLNLSSGVYFYLLEVKSTKGIPLFRDMKKMILIK